MAKPLLQRPKHFPKRRICMLMVTHACNLNCTYCYEEHKSERHMTPSLAKSILHKELAFVRDAEKFDELEVNFMGGEPFVNFSLITEIVEWLCDLDQPIPFVTSCPTNGTLIDDVKKPWLRKFKKQFIPGLSYDGDLSMQQRNRGTVRHPIDSRFFVETWPDQCIHITVSKETLPHLAEGVLDLQRQGAKLDVALAQGIEWTDTDASVFQQQLRQLRDAYLQDEELIPINLLARPLHGIIQGDAVQRKFCGTGTSMITYDLDGKTYPCHMFTPLVLGEEHALEMRQSGIVEDCHIADDFCRECPVINWCPTCYGFNYRLRGDISTRDHRWCTMIRTQAAVSCEFQIAYYHKHIGEVSPADLAQIKGALRAYESLTNHDQ